MKNLTLVVAMTVLLLAVSFASAVDEHHADQKPTATAPSAPKDAEKAVQQMCDNVNKMRAQMDRIQKAKDPAERQRLMREHMQTLRASMAAAGTAMGGVPGPGGTMGAGMMDCPMMGQMGAGMMGEQMMMQRMQQMEKRMDMMQMMLEQMRKQ